jgi:transketolase C-terminal domain/subunit
MASRTMPSVELRRTAAIFAAALGQVILSADALAYRPFDGTDASVIDPGELEVELGPAQLLREGSDRTLIAPAVVLNLGIFEGWEATL